MPCYLEQLDIFSSGKYYDSYTGTVNTIKDNHYVSYFLNVAENEENAVKLICQVIFMKNSQV